jgi:hypothetical protein
MVDKKARIVARKLVNFSLKILLGVAWIRTV